MWCAQASEEGVGGKEESRGEGAEGVRQVFGLKPEVALR